MKEILNINFIVLYSNDIVNQYYHYPLFYEYNKDIDTLVLIYENEDHFKLMGHFQDGEMVCFFNHEKMPCEILKIINFLR